MNLVLWSVFVLSGFYLLSVLVDFVITCFYPRTPYGFKGKLLYIDNDSTKKGFAYINRKWGCGANPDMLYSTGLFKYIVVELKSRSGPVHYSDIVQAKAGLLAVDGSYRFKKATHVMVVTNTTSRLIKVGSPRSVYNDIKQHIELAKDIKSGKSITATTDCKRKCDSCRNKDYC